MINLPSAVFLDRDGVINRHIPGGYAQSPSDLHVLPGVSAAIRRLNDAGIPVIVISNQQGVAKGLMTAGELTEIDAYLKSIIMAEAGAKVNRSYYCMHHKQEKCECRKPEPGMIRQASSDFCIDPTSAVLVGDSPTDLQAGRSAGVRTLVFVLTGGYKTYADGDFAVSPDWVAADLPAAIDRIFLSCQKDKD